MDRPFISVLPVVLQLYRQRTHTPGETRTVDDTGETPAGQPLNKRVLVWPRPRDLDEIHLFRALRFKTLSVHLAAFLANSAKLSELTLGGYLALSSWCTPLRVHTCCLNSKQGIDRYYVYFKLTPFSIMMVLFMINIWIIYILIWEALSGRYSGW